MSVAEPATSRRRFLGGLGVLAAGSAAAVVAAWHSGSQGPASPRSPGAAGARPNFVIILADDVGWGELGCYGQQKIQTPRLDRMAAEGLRFTDAYAAAPVCAPARACLFTGLHTGHDPVRRNPPRSGDLPLGPLPTVGTVLHSRGYRTGLFGKWGFGPDAPSPEHPDQHGFDDFFGYLTHFAAHHYYPERLWEGRRPVHLPGNHGETGTTYGPDLITDRAIAFLKQQRHGTPFLLMSTPNLPHAPSVVPDLGPYATKPWRRPDKVHAAQVTRLDDHVGRILEALRSTGLDDNTIVIFTSDNGPHEESGVHPAFFDASGPYRGLKRNLYEGGIRVPFIAWSPKLLARTAGKTSGYPTVHYDLLATMADFAGATVPRPDDGLSLRPVLTGTGTAPQHTYLYWSRMHAGATPDQVAQDHGRGRDVAAAVRFGRWKLLGFGPGRDYSTPGPSWTFELYDLDTDPGERHDISADHPTQVATGTKYLREAWLPPTPQAGPAEQPKKAQR